MVPFSRKGCALCQQCYHIAKVYFIRAEPERGEILWKQLNVIIPAYRPGKEFEKLLDSLSTQNYPVEKILVMNTEEKFWNTAWEKKFPKVNVVHLKKGGF